MHRFRKNLTAMIAPEGENADPAVPPGGTGQPPAAVPPAPGSADPPQPAPTGRGAKVITMQRATFAKQVRDAEGAGAKKEREALEARAKKLGFKDLDELLSSGRRGARLPAPAGGAAPTTAPAGTAPAGSRRHEKELERERKSRLAEKQARINAQRRAKVIQAELDSEQAERLLEKIAVAAGVQDVDYAVHLYNRHCAAQTSGKPPEEVVKVLHGMDEAKFFADLRPKHAHIFGAGAPTVVPADTSTGGGNRPPAPGAGPAVKAAATGDQFSARTATAEEISARVKKIPGLQMPGYSPGYSPHQVVKKPGA